MRRWLAFAAALGFLCVAAGAFAAHGLSDPQPQGWIRTGATYGLAHVAASLGALALARGGAPGARLAAPLFLFGVLLFSGSLAAMALGAPRWLGAVTPLGGAALIAGWIALALAARS